MDHPDPNNASLGRGDVFTDNHDRLCVAVRTDRPPSKGWLAEQRDGRMRDVPPDDRWWTAWPIHGGADRKH